MRLAQFGAVLAAVSVASVPASAQAGPSRPDSADEAAVRQVIAALPAAWNGYNMAAFGELFTPDADYVVITGRRLVGRDEIQRYHAELLSQLYKGSHLESAPTSTRFLGPDVALAQVVSEVTFNGGKDKRQGAALYVLARQGGRWRIASVHNTLAGGPPVRAPGAT